MYHLGDDFINSVTNSRRMQRAGRPASVEKGPRTMRFPTVTTSLPLRSCSCTRESGSPHGSACEKWRESSERRFDGSASLEVKRSFRHPRINESDRAFGNPYKRESGSPHGSACEKWREVPERRFDGSASPEVKGASRHSKRIKRTKRSTTSITPRSDRLSTFR